MITFILTIVQLQLAYRVALQGADLTPISAIVTVTSLSPKFHIVLRNIEIVINVNQNVKINIVKCFVVHNKVNDDFRHRLPDVIFVCVSKINNDRKVITIHELARVKVESHCTRACCRTFGCTPNKFRPKRKCNEHSSGTSCKYVRKILRVDYSFRSVRRDVAINETYVT